MLERLLEPDKAFTTSQDSLSEYLSALSMLTAFRLALP